MPPVLRTEGLSKRFGSFQAVDNLSLDVEEGDIYGFLGVNGAGKTTTMRMILRLIRPTSGSVSVFGLDTQKHFIDIMKRVGCLVELPAYYPYLSAWKNLEIVRLATGGIEEKRIPEMLELVGLGKRMHDRVRTFSQGMRQRLGIAMALLPRPKLVLLDEPTNGLDPHGINHIREVIKDLNRQEGVTFVISSHLLHEVEITCNRVGLIKHGKLLIQDTIQKILAKTMTGVRILGEPADRCAALLKDMGFAIADDPAGGLRVAASPERFADIAARLVQSGIALREISPLRQTLEEFFLAQ
jgi:ABC-type multidrug transport system ATPase subunit